MSRSADPVVLELAPLPREQIGPFLILGLDKDADKELIEANWAKRVIWARKNQTRLALEDVNWARETINDAERRVRSDCSSLNVDTADGLMRKLTARAGEAVVGWEPLDDETPLADFAPDADVPSADEIRAAVVLPDPPTDLPALPRLLDEIARAPIDPWALDLPLP